MGIVEGLNILIGLTQLAASATQSASAISGIIQGAQAAGRTEFTPDEWNQIVAQDNASRDSLVVAINAALKR